MTGTAADTTAETTDLLQVLIRNACVNDGHVESGGEARSVEALEAYLGTAVLGNTVEDGERLIACLRRVA